MKKKPSNADFIRSWGITTPSLIKAGLSWLRYKNPPEKGLYWYFFSQFIRQRDVEKYGTCISCSCPISIETAQAGHFMPAASCGRDLLFDPMNVHAECPQCNAWDETHLLGYAENLDKRYGEGTALALRKRRQKYKDSKTPLKDFTAKEYEELIKKLPSFQQSNPHPTV